MFVRRGTAYANISNYDLGMLQLLLLCDRKCIKAINLNVYLSFAPIFLASHQYFSF